MALSIFLYLFISTLVLILPLFYLYIKSRGSKNNPLLPIDWPILGILPSFIANLHNFHDYLTAVLAASGCNFSVHGPSTSTRFFMTSDPTNVRHIFTTNHANYLKGESFAEFFDIVSDTILTVDGEACRRQRAKIQSILGNPKMVSLMATCCHGKVANGLLPLLAGMASAGTPFDLQELIGRLVFDQTATPVFGVDPGRLSPDMPDMRVADAMNTVMEVAFFRMVVSPSLWKTMRWLNVGPERKLADAHVMLRGFVTEMLEKRKLVGDCEHGDKAVTSIDVLSCYITDPEYCSDVMLRKTLLNYMIGGRDTIGTALPWLFYSLAKNPGVVSNLRKEMAPIAGSRKGGAASAVSMDDDDAKMVVFEPEETKPLVYLQATLFESLRLYPPGPIERKNVMADDVLPSGHRVRRGEAILVSVYAIGRMESVWGKDCHEFRPERWLSEDGTKLQYVPSCKFMAFNSGPRMCLGKDIAIMEMKTIVAAVVWNFDVEVLEGQSIKPKISVLLQMENGLMVTVKKRGECNVL